MAFLFFPAFWFSENFFAGKSISEIHVKTRRKLGGGRQGRKVIGLDKKEEFILH